jgi:uncharacterized protein
MSVSERIARFSDRVFDRLRDRRAFGLTEDDATDGAFDSLRGHKYALLVTFRRNGEAVPSPVWFGLDDNGVVYVKTAADVGKVKRIRRDGRVLIAPCTMRGKPTGAPVRGVARLLASEKWADAEATIAAAYGADRKISERMLGGAVEMTFIEITPRTRG